MTYCVGILVNEGLVMIGDTRTNAGVDNIATFRKLHVFEVPGDRVAHDTFGLGRVRSTAGFAETAQAEIDFGGEVGVKRLLLRYAPIEKL